MVVLVATHPQRRYQSIEGVGISEEGRKQADRLDKRIQKQIKILIESLKKECLMPQKKTKGKLLAYWKLGLALQDVVASADFPTMAELPLLWRNVKLYLPCELLYLNRGPNREHLWYCFRLGKHPKKVVQKMKWGEWVTLFDSAGINEEPRFDSWFGQKLSKQANSLEREQIRMFVACVNSLLSGIDVPSLADKELSACYEATWQITSLWCAKRLADPNFSIGRQEIQSSIKKHLGLLDEVMEGEKTPGDFAEAVLEAAF